MSINKIFLLGNVGKDLRISKNSQGKDIATFSFGTSERWKTKNGEDKSKTEWHRIVVYNEGLAKLVAKYVKVGSKLYIEGSVHTRKYTDKGLDKYITEVVLKDYKGTIELLDPKEKQSEDGFTEIEKIMEEKETNGNIDVDDMPY